jgi:hypothetical protein
LAKNALLAVMIFRLKVGRFPFKITKLCVALFHEERCEQKSFQNIFDFIFHTVFEAVILCEKF